MNEFQFIEKLKNIPLNRDIRAGIKDDAAVIENQLLCSDTLVENTHFKLEYFSPIEAIIKSILVNLSDILAMNGKPSHYLLNLTVPKNQSNILENLPEEIEKINKEYKIDLIGGDTTSSENLWLSSVTMIGYSDNPIYRSGAKVGDNIYYCGSLGYSSFALSLLLKGIKNPLFKNYHIKPNIDFNYLSLFNSIKVESMIDISDGFLNDLSHILNQSNVGAVIDLDSFYDEIFFNEVDKYGDNPLKYILNGGEDFIPLFTSSTDKETILNIAKKLNLPIVCCGYIIDEKILISTKGDSLEPKGYVHF
ncbi:thiamine-phosphate kinase [bacterium]|nr:thiamine-phosphate kinase [bacterium]